MTNWSVGELYYAKLRRIVPGSSQRKWLGWLGYNADKKGYATFVDDENVNPATDTKVLPIQWVYEVEPDPSGGGGVTIVRQYLRTLSYADLGSCLLGGSGHNGFYCSWQEGHLSGMPGEAYALNATPVGGTQEILLSRRSDGSKIYTYDDWYMGYGKYGDEYEITFEFIPAAKFSAVHERWMEGQWAVIGDRPLPWIVIPGSHDAGSFQISPPGTNTTSKTQELGIHGQLMAGARYFDLRAWKAPDGIWKMYHGLDWTDVRLEDVIEQLATFLQAHSHEIVVASLLLEGKKGAAGFQGHLIEAWNMVFEKLHAHHLNYLDDQKTRNPRNINLVTPNSLLNEGKNFLLFAWGDTTDWAFKDSGHHTIFASPWGSRADGHGPGNVMDLDGVFLDEASASASDIVTAYRQYRRRGGMWILHTNTPWQFSAFWDSLYAKHERNAGALALYFDNGSISRDKANIVNIDYVGDPAVGPDGLPHDLVTSVINANLQT